MVAPRTEAEAIDTAIQIIQGYEGLGGLNPLNGRYYPYHCKADRSDVWTIGRGHVLSKTEMEKSHRFWRGLTLQEVNDLFAQDMKPRIIRCKVALGKYTLNQLAGALSHFYNYEAAYTVPGKTPREKHHAGEPLEAAKGMLLYIWSDGKKQLGLWRRQMSSALCYLTGEVMIAKEPQAEARLFARLKREIPDLAKPADLH